LEAQQHNIKMSDPTNTSSNGENSTRLKESESSSRQKRQCRSLSPIADQPAGAAAGAVVSSEKSIYDVPDAVLALSFAFVGKGTFRYTASVSARHFIKYTRALFKTRLTPALDRPWLL
jgi:hypothetical protein